MDLDKEKEKDLELEQYISQMNDTQKKAYHIAKAHLKTSFNVFKSIGYLDWKKKQIQHQVVSSS